MKAKTRTSVSSGRSSNGLWLRPVYVQMMRTAALWSATVSVDGNKKGMGNQNSQCRGRPPSESVHDVLQAHGGSPDVVVGWDAWWQQLTANPEPEPEDSHELESWKGREEDEEKNRKKRQRKRKRTKVKKGIQQVLIPCLCKIAPKNHTHTQRDTEKYREDST